MKFLLSIVFLSMDVVATSTFDECPVDFGALDNETKFGHNMLKYFELEDGYVNLNHGSYGATPKLVTECFNYWHHRAEANPDRWLRYEVLPRLENAAAVMAKYMKIRDSKDLAFVPNLSSGVNAILRSLKLSATDVLVHFSEAYGSVKLAMQYVAHSSGAKVVEIPVKFPFTDEEILDSLERTLDQNANNVKLVVVSHISSVPTALFPVKDMVKVGRKKNVPVLVDAAHSLGQLEVDVQDLDPDFYVTNCHKWFFGARGSGIIYVRKNFQATVHPVVISWNYNAGFQAEFHQQGTLDYSAFLTVPAALQFRTKLGDKRIMDYNRQLAQYAAKTLTQAWKTELLQPATETQTQLSMINVRLPLNDSIVAHTIVERLMLSHRTFMATFVDQNRWYARISAQIYNEPTDYDKLAADVLQMKKLLEGPVTNAYPYCVKE